MILTKTHYRKTCSPQNRETTVFCFFLLPLGFFEQMKINFSPLINSVFEQVQIWKLSNSLMVQFLNNILVLDVFCHSKCL